MTAVQSMRTSGVYDEIMWIHADKTNFNFAHLTDGFLPWHRQYLLMMEDALRSTSPEANCIAIPYWDWTLDAANPLGSIVWQNDYFGGNGVDSGNGKKCVRSGPFAWNILGNDCLQRDLNGAGFFATREEVLNTIASNDNFREFSRALELFHDTVHRFIGGTMVLDNSADEPLFMLHHSFIDMIWSIWQDCHDYDLIPSTSVRSNTNVYSGGYETGSLGTVINTEYSSVMPYLLSHFSPQIAPLQMHSCQKLGYSYDNMHIVSKPMTIEWFDPRWTTCSIENLESFKASPQKFTSAASQGQAFQALEDTGAIVVANSTDWIRYSGPVMGPDAICAQNNYLNFTNKCACVRRWRPFELRYVAKALPSCQRPALLACLAGKR
jgi:tyrosinase